MGLIHSSTWSRNVGSFYSEPYLWLYFFRFDFFFFLLLEFHGRGEFLWCLRLHGLVSRFDADVQTLYIFIVRLPWLLLQLTIGTHLNPFSLMSSIFQPVLWNVFF